MRRGVYGNLLLRNIRPARRVGGKDRPYLIAAKAPRGGQVQSMSQETGKFSRLFDKKRIGHPL